MREYGERTGKNDRGGNAQYGQGRPRTDHRNDKKRQNYDRNDSKTDEKESGEVIYGRNSVIEALRSDVVINKILISESAAEGSGKVIVALAAEKGIVLNKCSSKKIDQASGTENNQGVMAYVAAEKYYEVSDILAMAEEKNEKPFIIILDEIQDPNNLGAIIRSADALGAHGVIIPKRKSALLTGAVAKASAGATAYVPVARVTNIVRTIEDLKKNGLWIIGTAADGEKAFYEADLDGAVGLVIGSEGFGMGKLVRESCDYVLNIPMSGHVTSLNASVAAGIVMYEIFKKRKES